MGNSLEPVRTVPLLVSLAVLALPLAGCSAAAQEESRVKSVEARIDGLKANYAVDDPDTLAFFELHAQLDVQHSGTERKIIEELGAGHEDEVLAATDEALDGWWRFLDAVTPEEEA